MSVSLRPRRGTGTSCCILLLGTKTIPFVLGVTHQTAANDEPPLPVQEGPPWSTVQERKQYLLAFNEYTFDPPRRAAKADGAGPDAAKEKQQDPEPEPKAVPKHLDVWRNLQSVVDHGHGDFESGTRSDDEQFAEEDRELDKRYKEELERGVDVDGQAAFVEVDKEAGAEPVVVPEVKQLTIFEGWPAFFKVGGSEADGGRARPVIGVQEIGALLSPDARWTLVRGGRTVLRLLDLSGDSNGPGAASGADGDGQDGGASGGPTRPQQSAPMTAQRGTSQYMTGTGRFASFQGYNWFPSPANLLSFFHRRVANPLRRTLGGTLDVLGKFLKRIFLKGLESLGSWYMRSSYFPMHIGIERRAQVRTLPPRSASQSEGGIASILNLVDTALNANDSGFAQALLGGLKAVYLDEATQDLREILNGIFPGNALSNWKSEGNADLRELWEVVLPTLSSLEPRLERQMFSCRDIPQGGSVFSKGVKRDTVQTRHRVFVRRLLHNTLLSSRTVETPKRQPGRPLVNKAKGSSTLEVVPEIGEQDHAQVEPHLPDFEDHFVHHHAVKEDNSLDEDEEDEDSSSGMDHDEEVFDRDERPEQDDRGLHTLQKGKGNKDTRSQQFLQVKEPDQDSDVLHAAASKASRRSTAARQDRESFDAAVHEAVDHLLAGDEEGLVTFLQQLERQVLERTEAFLLSQKESNEQLAGTSFLSRQGLETQTQTQTHQHRHESQPQWTSGRDKEHYGDRGGGGGLVSRMLDAYHRVMGTDQLPGTRDFMKAPVLDLEILDGTLTRILYYALPFLWDFGSGNFKLDFVTSKEAAEERRARTKEKGKDLDPSRDLDVTFRSAAYCPFDDMVAKHDGTRQSSDRSQSVFLLYRERRVESRQREEKLPGVAVARGQLDKLKKEKNADSQPSTSEADTKQLEKEEKAVSKLEAEVEALNAKARRGLFKIESRAGKEDDGIKVPSFDDAFYEVREHYQLVLRRVDIVRRQSASKTDEPVKEEDRGAAFLETKALSVSTGNKEKGKPSLGEKVVRLTENIIDEFRLHFPEDLLERVWWESVLYQHDHETGKKRDESESSTTTNTGPRSSGKIPVMHAAVVRLRRDPDQEVQASTSSNGENFFSVGKNAESRFYRCGLELVVTPPRNEGRGWVSSGRPGASDETISHEVYDELKQTIGRDTAETLSLKRIPGVKFVGDVGTPDLQNLSNEWERRVGSFRTFLPGTVSLEGTGTGLRPDEPTCAGKIEAGRKAEEKTLQTPAHCGTVTGAMLPEEWVRWRAPPDPLPNLPDDVGPEGRTVWKQMGTTAWLRHDEERINGNNVAPGTERSKSVASITYDMERATKTREIFKEMQVEGEGDSTRSGWTISNILWAPAAGAMWLWSGNKGKGFTELFVTQNDRNELRRHRLQLLDLLEQDAALQASIGQPLTSIHSCDS